ncbi:DUF1534 domain-containing protein [Pseudomonas savastanoi]|nr:DUF1534 domain-containing protein [Pseudomonas savastanoi]
MRLSFPTLQRGNAVLDAPRRKRTRSVRNGMRRGASHDNCDDRSARLERHVDAERRTAVEMIVPYAPAWECSSRRSASQEDAERPERHATRSVAR